MEQIDLKQLIEQYPEVLTDSAKLKSYILDLYPSTTPTRVHQRLSQNNLRKRQISCETTADLAK